MTYHLFLSHLDHCEMTTLLSEQACLSFNPPYFFREVLASTLGRHIDCFDCVLSPVSSDPPLCGNIVLEIRPQQLLYTHFLTHYSLIALSLGTIL
jgi:hypothetical protein